MNVCAKKHDRNNFEHGRGHKFHRKDSDWKCERPAWLQAGQAGTADAKVQTCMQVAPMNNPKHGGIRQFKPDGGGDPDLNHLKQNASN